MTNAHDTTMIRQQGYAEPQRDGRQSEAALGICRGTCRLLAAHGFAVLTEVTLPNGRRADIVALGPRGEIAIVEIKSSVADFRADHKWSEYREFADHVSFAVSASFPADILPADTGLIVADAYGAEVIRPAPSSTLAPARRRSLTLRLARVAAVRLHALADPAAEAERLLADRGCS